MERTIRLTTFFPQKPEILWPYLTDAALLTQWFMANDIKAEPDAEFTFRMAPQKGWDGVTHCRITTIVPNKLIAYTYRGAASGEKPLACAGIESETADKAAKHLFLSLDTVLSFALHETTDGTNLELVHSGYKGLKMVLVSLIMGMGWKKQMKKLTALLASRA